MNRLHILFLFSATCCFLTTTGFAQPENRSDKSSSQTGYQLQIQKQELLTKSLEILESKIIKLIQFETNNNSQRARILKKGLELSQSAGLVEESRKILALMKKGSTIDLESAVSNQKKILKSLNQLYTVLESDQSLKTNQGKRKKLREQINLIQRLIQKQQNLRQRLERTDKETLLENQQQIQTETNELEKQVEVESNPLPESTETGSDSGSPNKTNEKNTNRIENGTDQEAPNAANHLGTAQKGMKKAQKHLQDEDRKSAGEQMDIAEKELGNAKQSLEERLRQNREEEIVNTLRSMEARFEGMLKQQTKINEATQRLAQSESKQAEKRIESFRLAADQRKVILEVDKALLVLAEEGSSRSLSGTLAHVKMDMQDVASSLEQSDLGTQVLDLQTEIVEILSELVQAIEQEQKEQAELQRSGQPSNANEVVMERPLVQKLAELKIIRQLQIRINNRHQSYAKQFRKTNETTTKETIRSKIGSLAERQKQLEETTRDLIREVDQ